MMKMRRAVALTTLILTVASGASAQTPDSLFAVSYGGQSRYRVNIDGGAVWGGTFDGDFAGDGVPREGAGTRMMWYARKAALRAGGINGTQWDAANIGLYSVALGQDVRASGDNGVAMGLRATAANTSSFAVGEDVTASGYASVAFGYHAHTNARRGSFVFGDNVTGGTSDTIRADMVGQATWRVSCGMRIFTQQNLSSGVSIGGPAVNSSVCGSNNYWGQSGAMISTSTGAYLSTSGVWTNASDINRKHDFRDITGEFVLARLRDLQIRTWSYKTDEGIRHIGPTAQDFHAAFGFGGDDKAIGTVDADGVSLAGIQALDLRTLGMQSDILALRKRNDDLQRANEELRARLERLEALLGQ